ncbi:MAG: methionyl-tRNA formyltransferase [Bauldia sp.]|nr:methionyl-tRNA formyltransferase [Bauldia sp.]
MTLRIVFMGTPDFAVPTLTEIVGQGHEVLAVYTQPPRPAGRGMAERPSPVHVQAVQFGIPVRTPKTLRNAEEQALFAALEADAAVVVAYGLILPQAVLDATKLGRFNLHGSLLPRWRGAAPIQRAVMAGDTETGVMVMRMEAGLDIGPVAMGERIAIPPDMTAGQLHDRMALVGADLMVRALAALERGSLGLTPQAEAGVTYAAKIDKAETRIDWSRPAAEVHNHIRGLSPFPGAWTEMPLGGKAERVKVLRSVVAEGAGVPGTVLDDGLTVATGAGAVRLVELQRAGGKAVPADAFLRGAGLPPRTMLV